MNRLLYLCYVAPITALVLAAAVSGPVTPVHPDSPWESAASIDPVLCPHTSHPIEVTIEALDPIEPGALVRLQLTTRSQLRLESARIRLLHAGSASVESPRQAWLGSLDTRARTIDAFAVRVPETGRALVQFEIAGEGPTGPLGRGASFNLLPGGPSTPSRIVVGVDGRPVAEYSARRITP